MKRWRLVGVVLALAVTAAFARDDDDFADARAREIAALVVEKPDVPAKSFEKAFLAAVPVSKMAGLLADMWQQSGEVVSVKKLAGDKLSGRFLLEQKRGTRSELSVSVGAKAPHRITSLWLKPAGIAARTLGDLEKECARLDGRVSFAVARLGAGGPATLAAFNEDEPLGIGSSFKLWVLGQLVDDIHAGKRRWTDVVTLDPARRSLPSGQMHGWADGSPVTLHTLASMMISISDNTATDNLIGALGRERIERHMEVMGARSARRSWPFLTTSEMFRLKWGEAGAAKAFLAADLAGKRALLAKLDRKPLPDVSSVSGDPRLISEIEWFASANDLVRTMDWLREATRTDELARGVLAINNGGVNANGWRWIGFKGGSEPGVLELAWLLHRSDDAWFAVCIGWNDPESAVDLVKLGGIGQRALELLADAKPAEVH